MGDSLCSSPLEESLPRVRAEYWEMPGLQLTPLQAQRLFGLEPLVCLATLEALLEENYLSRTNDGLFRRSAPQE